MPGVSLDGLQPLFRARVEALIVAASGKVWVKSGYRSTKRQIVLYAQAVLRYGPRKASRYVARPGYSNHEKGEAVDFGGDLALVSRLAPRHGLRQPMSWEDWHYERDDLKVNPRAYTTPPPTLTMEDQEMAGFFCVMPRGATANDKGRFPFYSVSPKGEVFNHNMPNGYGIRGLPERKIVPVTPIIGVALHPNVENNPAKRLNIILFERDGGTHDIGPNN